MLTTVYTLIFTGSVLGPRVWPKSTALVLGKGRGPRATTFDQTRGAHSRLEASTGIGASSCVLPVKAWR
eukprot:15437378-Alexandrium_andersonii.AAC.1